MELFDRSVDERYSLSAQVLATTRDVAELETRLAREIAGLETRLSREIAASKVDMVKSTVAALTAQTALLLGAAKLF